MPELLTNSFSLCIGIDKYKSAAIRPLRGAVADARAVVTYLRELSVPRDHIAVLENELATRAAILQAFQRLATDSRIQRGDPILIYYAGHGSEAAAPPEWETEGPNTNVHLVLPYDVYCSSGSEVVAPIPDRTLGALLEAISQEKGNNITVVLDSCYSSGKRFDDSSDLVRSVPHPSDFQLQGGLDQAIWSSFPTNNGLRSHILLSACGSSDQAWESEGRGSFTVALLDLFKRCPLNKLRYSDIIKRMEDIDRNQSPQCVGFNQDRYMFTTTSPPPAQHFIPAYTRTARNGPIAYILSGGAAHGLAVGDEFAILPDMDKPVFPGTLRVDKVGPFYSTLQLVQCGIPISPNAVAVRVKEESRQALRIHIRPDDGALETLFRAWDSAQELSRIEIVRTPEKCNIDVSIHDNRAVFRLRNPKNIGGFHIVPTAEELGRILKASWKFFSELDRTADFPDITQHIQVEVYELQMWSQSSDAPTAEQRPWRSAPHVNGSFTLRQGSSYGLKLTNDSCYNLYPTVQYFDPTDEFSYDTWYRPPCTRSRLDAPLKKGGGSFIIGYGSGGSPPLVIPSSDQEGFGFLKVSLFSRPLDPFYEAQSFRSARYVHDNLKEPWATIIKPVFSYPPETRRPNPSSRPPQAELAISQPTRATNGTVYFYPLLHPWPTSLKLNSQTTIEERLGLKASNVQCSTMSNNSAEKSIFPVLLFLHIFLPDSKLRFHGQGKEQEYILQIDGSQTKMSLGVMCGTQTLKQVALNSGQVLPLDKEVLFLVSCSVIFTQPIKAQLSGLQT